MIRQSCDVERSQSAFRLCVNDPWFLQFSSDRFTISFSRSRSDVLPGLRDIDRQFTERRMRQRFPMRWHIKQNDGHKNRRCQG